MPEPTNDLNSDINPCLYEDSFGAYYYCSEGTS